ncbi:MAG: NAD-dependent epimerase/dehydratase family protein [Anaerolineales bacterium]
MQKILVTGGCGFIGSHVVDAFLAQGYEVVVVDNLSAGSLKNLNPQAKFYEVDIRSAELADIFDIERPDFVDHHAAQIDVRLSAEKPCYDADVNILGTLNLLECAVRLDVKKFIFISSGGAVYGEPEYLPCDEAHPIQPLSPYGVSKHAIELYLYLYKEIRGLDYTILRYANVYGPRQDPQGEAGVVAIFTDQMLRDDQVTINGSGEQLRDFVYVEDCVAANLLAAKDRAGQIYNIGTGRGISVNELFHTLAEITGYQREPYYGPAKLGETFRSYLAAEKAHQGLGWEPTVTLEEGVRRTVAYFSQK